MLTALLPGKFRVPPPACSASPLPDAADELSAISAPNPRALPLRLAAEVNTELSVDVVNRSTTVLAALVSMPPATSTWPLESAAAELLAENWRRGAPGVAEGRLPAAPSCRVHEPTLMAPTRVVTSSDVGVDGCL